MLVKTPLTLVQGLGVEAATSEALLPVFGPKILPLVPPPELFVVTSVLRIPMFETPPEEAPFHFKESPVR